MIVEHAVFIVDADRSSEFEDALEKASAVIGEAAGFLGVEVLRQVEEPGRYVLSVRWETLKDHTVRFRTSELSIELRSLLAPHLVAPTEVRHHEVLTERRS